MRKARVFWLFLGAVASGCATNPTSPSETAASLRFSAWLQVFNSGNPMKLQQHLQENFVLGSKTLFKQRMVQETVGSFELAKVDESTLYRFIAQLRAKGSGLLYGLAVEVEPAAPHRVSRFALVQLSSQLPDSEALQRGRTFVEEQAAKDQFSGVVLVARHGEPIFHQAYGFADRERKIPNRLDTRFSTASVGKAFTAVAILQLVQTGKVRLDATLGEYMTDYPNREIASKTTIHQLLTHTGGTGDIDWPASAEDQLRGLRNRTVSDYIRTYGTRGPEFEPGSRWSYSNYGYILLGAVIEKVSGENYYDYIVEHVFKPAGMVTSGFPTIDQPDPEAAVGYTKGSADVSWRPNTDRSFYRAIPAGGASTTAGDLMRFADALLEHKLLDATHTSLLTIGKVEIDRGGVYAYGLLDVRAEGGAWFGHGGGAEGMSTDLRIYPWSDYVVVALANMDPPISDYVVQEFADWLSRD